MLKRRIVIVGRDGAIAQFFANWLTSLGHSVEGFDRQTSHRAAEVLPEADLVIVAVPIDRTESVIRQVGPYLTSNTVLADITSIKRQPVQVMLEAHHGPVVGLHPMFGPTSDSVSNQVLVHCGGRLEQQLHWFCDAWIGSGGTVLYSNPTEHDHMMATIQAVRHFTTFVFGCHLQAEDVDLNRTLAFSSPIYRLELGMVGRLFAQQAELYADIIFNSEEGLDILRRYHNSFGALLSELEQGNREQFIERFATTKAWFGPLADVFLDESSKLLNAAVSQRKPADLVMERDS